MPARQPFTALCRAAAQGPACGRADLHLHSTCSDGAYRPAQVVDLARRSGLAAIALTDHDTLAGLAEAVNAAAGTSTEIVTGVEISAEFRGRELHLLGYFFRADDGPLRSALERLVTERQQRFWEMVDRLKHCGVALADRDLRPYARVQALGRRHVAELLVRARQAGSVRQAFTRYLHDGGRVAVPKARLPVAEAIALVRGAGGVAAWAHPSYDCTKQALEGLRACGLQAVEIAWPSCRPSRARELRAWAAELGLAVTGGSDCHGPGNHLRAVGAHG